MLVKGNPVGIQAAPAVQAMPEGSADGVMDQHTRSRGIGVAKRLDKNPKTVRHIYRHCGENMAGSNRNRRLGG